MKDNNILILLYGHPEYYPPTLNAIDSLSLIMNRLDVVHRPFLKYAWEYPSNVNLHASGKIQSVRNQENASFFLKLRYFLNFSFLFLKIYWKTKPNIILAYDYLPILSLMLLKPFIGKSTIWYHNHDVLTISNTRKYSLTWMSIKLLPTFFKMVTLFTLPSTARKDYFPLSKFTGKYYLLPNFPSKKYYNFQSKVESVLAPIKLLYQGQISKGHGLESIIEFINSQNNGEVKYELHLAGNVETDYLSFLNSNLKIVKHKLIYHGKLPYAELPQLTAGCHIGLAILEPEGINFKTAATASNKIYEYAACGLPVIYLNDDYYKASFFDFKWTIPVDLEIQSIQNAIYKIIDNYQELSNAALLDFNTNLNYETHFQKIDFEQIS